MNITKTSTDTTLEQHSDSTVVSEGEFHTHLHEHDGIVHTHFHTHKNGKLEHTHPDPLDKRNDLDPSIQSCPATPHNTSHFHQVTGDCILEAHDLTYYYPNAEEPVFSDVSLQSYAGSMLAILGNNGAGKSTLLNLLGNITTPHAGHVTVCDDNLSSMSRREIAQHIAYVSQQQRIPHLSVYDEVLLGRKPHVSWTITNNDREIVSASIKRLQLEKFVNRFCDELSGGERQKVYVARALAQETEVLLLDEPTSALDPKNQMEVLQVISEITKESSLATIMVLHDLNLALRFCDRFMLLRDGEVIAQGGHEVVTNETLSKTYDTPMEIYEIGNERIVVPTRLEH